MAEALADRLAEAVAEKLHEDVRKDMWGYAPDECMSPDDMLKVKYQGIRPAPGYPSQPDHTEKTTMWDLMKVKEEIDCELTDSLAMLPAASVSGMPPALLACLLFQVFVPCILCLMLPLVMGIEGVLLRVHAACGSVPFDDGRSCIKPCRSSVL